MAVPALHGLALCAGVGMLDEGARLAFEHLGFDYSTVCYVEREIHAAAQLVTLMEAGIIDQAAVWSDLVTFDGTAWRGRVDCVSAGFPCQPHSVAGKREGLDDERWIWPDIVRIIGDVRPRLILLENVPGLASTGGLDACIGDLAALGYSAEWALLSASAVGASHERERIFIFAWLADAGLQYEHVQQRAQRASEHPRSGSKLEDSARDERDGFHGESWGRRGVREASDDLGNTSRDRRRQGRTELCRQSRRSDSPGASGSMGDPERSRRTQTGSGPTQYAARQPESRCSDVADACRARSQGRELYGTRDDDRGGAQAHGSVSELCGAFAPSPNDQRWAAILDIFPFLAPATESGLRGVADGLAVVVDESRSDQLRAVGNGVVALTAACAYVLLARRSGAVNQLRDLFERAAA